MDPQPPTVPPTPAAPPPPVGDGSAAPAETVPPVAGAVAPVDTVLPAADGTAPPADATPGDPPPSTVELEVVPTPPTPSSPTPDPDAPLPIAIEIAEDDMEATMILQPGVTLESSEALDRLIRAGVIAGVLEEPLRELSVPSEEERRIVVARGVAPVLSQDARVDVLIDFSIKLSEDAEHKTDFRDQKRFHEVDVGQVLARMIPKVQGTPGRTVLGKELIVAEPRDADLASVCGEGTRIEAKGDGQVVSERAGLILRRRDGHLDVMPAFEISGDLDMRVGNVDTKMSVSISGDVIAGFSLKSAGAVEIKGVIEDARISVKGNLTCGGILPGAHRVKSHGDITTKHVAGRIIKCRNLNIASDLRGSTVFAIGDVTAKKVISCTVTCGGSLTCDELGNAMDMGGNITVGMNPLAVALYKLAMREHDTLEAEVAEARQKIKKLANWTRDESNEARRQKLAHDLKHVLAAYEATVQRLASCDKVISNSTLRGGNNPNAVIVANMVVHPGVEIHIGAEAKLVVEHTLGKTTFRLVDGQIVTE